MLPNTSRNAIDSLGGISARQILIVLERELSASTEMISKHPLLADLRTLPRSVKNVT